MNELLVQNFKIRLVEERDVAFIVELRTNKQLSKHLHPTSSDIDAQIKWIRSYKEREKANKEYYFISETYNGERLGLSRLYNLKSDSFELGSWIFKKGIPESIPILADLSVRDFGFDQLRLSKCFFEVRKENKSVIRYHALFKPTLIGKDENNFYYELDKEVYKTNKQRILKIIGNGSH